MKLKDENGKPANLTDAIAKNVPLPPGSTQVDFFEDEVKNFCVRVRASGARSWRVQYYFAGKVHAMNLGRVGDVKCNKARAAARDAMAKVRLGENPAATKRERGEATAAADAMTFGALLPRYLREKQQEMRQRSFEEIERHLTDHAKKLHKRPIEAITQREAATFLDDIHDTKGPAAYNRVRSTLVAFYNRLSEKGIVERNPFKGTPKLEETPRKRHPSLPELVEIWHAAGQCHSYGHIVRLLMLTGCRRDEIAALGWSEINDDKGMIVISGERTKNKVPLEIMLTPAMRAVLAQIPRRGNADGSPRDFLFGEGKDNGFSNFSSSKRILDIYIQANREKADPNAAPMEDWTLHDFRRSFTTIVNDATPEWHAFIEFCLNHIEGAKGGVKKHYNQALYREPKARVWTLWNNLLTDALQGRALKVVPLRRGGDDATAA